jgi:hypothetical protein
MQVSHWRLPSYLHPLGNSAPHPEKAVLVVGDWGARASGSASAHRLHMKHHTPSMGVGTLRLFRRAGYQVGGLLV